MLDKRYARNATLAGAEAALGHDDTCVITVYEPRVSWPRIGVSGIFTTLGAFAHPDGKYDPHGNGCEYRAQVQPDSITVTGAGWHTNRGLHVNDSVSAMYRLYPEATYHSGFGDELGGWWLQSASMIPPSPPEGVLIAYVKNGRISAIRLRIGAEGE